MDSPLSRFPRNSYQPYLPPRLPPVPPSPGLPPVLAACLETVAVVELVDVLVAV